MILSLRKIVINSLAACLLPNVHLCRDKVGGLISLRVHPLWVDLKCSCTLDASAVNYVSLSERVGMCVYVCQRLCVCACLTCGGADVVDEYLDVSVVSRAGPPALCRPSCVQSLSTAASRQAHSFHSELSWLAFGFDKVCLKWTRLSTVSLFFRAC